VTVFCFVLNVSGVDRDTTSLLFGSRVDLVVRFSSTAELGSQHGGDGSSQGGFAVVNVTDGAHVHVGLGPFEFFLSHFSILKKSNARVLV
jgi:hypothetical protein